MSHPKKFEIAKKIIEARKDKKIITFSATIKAVSYTHLDVYKRQIRC